jgi:hypothetical protein
MDVNLLQTLRLLHIVAATFWVGTAVTLGFFVFPVLLNGDVANGRLVRQIMMGRKLSAFLPIAMLLVVISGLFLYRLDFPNMATSYGGRRGLDYTLGAFLGILAAIVGVTVTMPTGLKIGAVIDSVGAGTPTAEQSNELLRLSRKLIIASRSLAILLLGAAALMALARHAG